MSASVTKVEQYVSNYRSMVAHHAWAVWKKLPPQTRLWIGVDDLIADGIQHMLYVLQRYDSRKGMKFGTYFFSALENHYDQHFIQRHYAKMRKDTGTVHLSALQDRYTGPDGRMPSVDEALAIAGFRTEIPNVGFELCGVSDGVVDVYKAASDELQESMIRWFLLPRRGKEPLPRIRLRKEFRQLADEAGLTIEGCRHMFRSPECLDKVSRELRWVPFDLSNPTPGLRGQDIAWPIVK